MQVPFHSAYNNNRRFPPPSHLPWRPNFAPRGPPSRFRSPAPHWRQPSPQALTNEFWCETCDRGFRTSDILAKHKQEHQKCNIDGCQFIAHPKVITKHIQMQHASGLYEKIAKLRDPEEIKKWREERKKKYPTKENVEKAAAAIKEKIERGEKMGLKNKRHEKIFKTDSGGVPGMGGKRQPFNQRHACKIHVDQIVKSSAPDINKRKVSNKSMVKTIPVAEDTRKLRPFTGVQELLIDVTDTDELQDDTECGFTIEDEDELENTTTPTEAPSGSVCHALSSLMCNYGSSDEEESNIGLIAQRTLKPHHTNASSKKPTASSKDKLNERPIVLLSQTHSKNQLLVINSVERETENDDDSGPEEVKVTKQLCNEVEPSEIKPLINQRKSKNKISQKPVFKRPKSKLPSSLLQKLLFKEIKHERNIVLQCIRHIIKNNFFNKSVE